jgi:hypothetical protein
MRGSVTHRLLQVALHYCQSVCGPLWPQWNSVGRSIWLWRIPFLTAKAVPLFFSRSGKSNKGDDLEWRTSHYVSDAPLRAELHLYVSLQLITKLITVPPTPICIKTNGQRTLADFSFHSVKYHFYKDNYFVFFWHSLAESCHDLLHHSGDF